MPQAEGLQAILFDCDGVLSDTERDGHRVAFNEAFAAQGLDVAWSVERYGELLTTGGGKERMRRHFDETGWPVPEVERDALIAALHKDKTDRFVAMIEAGRLPLRAGVARLVDEAMAAGVRLGVCSTSNERAVQGIVSVNLGPERAAAMPVFAGDVVPKKKPDPAIYRLAADRLGLDPSRCVVVEDSANGLKAALAAGMRCVVTISSYTGEEDFSGAARVIPELGDGPGVNLTVEDCAALVA